MDDKQGLLGKTKEELVEIILELEQRIKALEDKINGKLKDPPFFVKPNIHHYHHKPGQKDGHEGISRLSPVHIDETIEQTLSLCPDCHNPLGQSVEVIEHIQEDVIPAQAIARKYRRHRYYCPCCKKIITAPYHENEVPQGRLGANVLIQTAILKYYHCLPYAKIAALFKELCGLNVSPGALAQSLQRISKWLRVEQKVILEAIRGSPQVHADETGWRMNGKNHWLWAFVNQRLAYYRVEPSRGRKIVKDTLTEEYNGTLISDFYGVYFRLPYKMQKCLVHLLRELHDTAKRDNSKQYLAFYKQIKRIIDDAIRLKENKPDLIADIYQRRFARIKQRLFLSLGSTGSTNKNICRLAKRFSKFWLDMLTFLEVDNVDWNNNLAERMIRPNVIYRNRSFGNRSVAGAATHASLMSIIQTLRLRKENVFAFLKDAYLTHRQGNLLPLLSES